MLPSGVSLTTVKQPSVRRQKSGKRRASAALELTFQAKASKVTTDTCKLLPAATSCMCRSWSRMHCALKVLSAACKNVLLCMHALCLICKFCCLFWWHWGLQACTDKAFLALFQECALIRLLAISGAAISICVLASLCFSFAASLMCLCITTW